MQKNFISAQGLEYERGEWMFTFEEILKLIGSFIISLIIVAIPILCTLSYVLDWNFLITYILAIMTVGMIILGALFIYMSGVRASGG